MLAVRDGAARPACPTSALSPTSDVQKPPTMVLSFSPGPRCVFMDTHYKQIWLVSLWVRAHNPISEVFGNKYCGFYIKAEKWPHFRVSNYISGLFFNFFFRIRSKPKQTFWKCIKEDESSTELVARRKMHIRQKIQRSYSGSATMSDTPKITWNKQGVPCKAMGVIQGQGKRNQWNWTTRCLQY